MDTKFTDLPYAIASKEDLAKVERIIKAAPKLLEAMIAFRDSGPDGGQDFFNWHESYHDAIEKARVAIAEATNDHQT